MIDCDQIRHLSDQTGRARAKSQFEIIRLAIVHALTRFFLCTLVVICLSFMKVVKSVENELKRKLVDVLVVEVGVTAAGSSLDPLNLDPARVSNAVMTGD